MSMNENISNIEQQICSLSEQILHHPDDPLLFYRRGAFYYALNKSELAVIDFQKAVSLGLNVEQMPYYSFLPQYSYSFRDNLVLGIFLLLTVLFVIADICKIIFSL